MSEILVRPAVLEDVPAIVGVRYRSWLCAYPNERYGITAQDIESLELDGPSSCGRWRRRVGGPRPGERTWVGERDGAVRGFLHAHDANGPWVNSFYVDPPAWRSGIGRALLATALEYFGPGASVGLQVVTYNDRAIAFYRAMGFVLSEEASPPAAPFPNGKLMPTVRMDRWPVG